MRALPRGSSLVGIQRGIFSSEAGLGTGAITSSIVDDKVEEKQGFIQILGIYITTIIICGSTALIILTSNYNSFIFNNINGIEIARYAFNYHLQSFGDIILLVSITLFSFSTILTSYYYGETSLKFIFGKTNNYQLNILKIITATFVLFGSLLSASILWHVVDILVGVLAITNIYALIKLRKNVNL